MRSRILMEPRSMTFLVRVALVLFFSSSLFGQIATLRGVITDPSGAIVPGATVTLTTNAGTVTTAVTASDGSFCIAGIATGDCTVQASAPDLTTQPMKV